MTRVVVNRDLQQLTMRIDSPQRVKNSLTIFECRTKNVDSSLKRGVAQTTKLASHWDLE